MYAALFSLTGVFLIAVGGVLFAAPEAYLSLYVPSDVAEASFAARRLAAPVCGLGGLLLLARNLPTGAFASRVAWLISAVWLGVAATGIFHFLTGAATRAILIAAATEVILALLFGLAALQKRPPR
ncbi:hypothetical protein [Thalassorhabdomicrobium marinisediminis]|uniref:DUF4345 domain-containing protein n=1 Tax=Thalassorhabdomicrobium marinisediminis TaxID=2170577 RepID=A0A2T7G1F1_9RHOB|nr:hypothetical protein [Thalassorhabdomicrobium marinisediminis]PVA08218.1 hypothetical protein DC363_01600 [Thalassorhabdomicrobium marinisediminis]